MRTIPGLVEPELLVELSVILVMFLQVGEDRNSPTQERLALSAEDRRRREVARDIVVVVQGVPIATEKKTTIFTVTVVQ